MMTRIFTHGATTVIYFANDGAGLTPIQGCGFVVTVVDNQAPMLMNCPPDTIVRYPIDCEQNVAWHRPTANDNCTDSADIGLQLFFDNPNINPIGPVDDTLFALFPSGMTKGYYVATDTSGNADTCAFVVWIKDTIAPTIDCPGTFTLPYCETGSTVIPGFTASDNCSPDGPLDSTMIMQTPAAGTLVDDLPQYATTDPMVGDTFSINIKATDEQGNMSTCKVLVILVDDDQPPVPVLSTLPDIINTCDAVIVKAPIADDCGTIVYGKPTFNNMDAGEPIVGSDPPCYRFVTSDPNLIVWKYSDNEGVAEQTQLIDVSPDIHPPLLHCPNDITLQPTDPDVCYADSIAYAAMHYTASTTIIPAGYYTDICSDSADITIEYALSGASTVARTTGNDAGVEIFNHGMTKVTYWATDAEGNTDSCYFYVTVKDKQGPSIIGNIADTAINCDAFVPPPVVNIYDNCSPADSLTVDFDELIFLGACPNERTIRRTWTLDDTCGNRTVHTQHITIRDTTAPVFPPMADTMYISTDLGFCYATVSLEIDPDDVLDNCNDTVYIWNDAPEGNGLNSASGVYLPGIHSFNFYAVDSCGNVRVQSKTLIIEDNEPPLVGCVININLGLSPSGLIFVQKDLIVTAYADNCSDKDDITITLSEDTLSCDDVGPNGITVVVTATDEAGNQSQCDAVVNIQENVNPVAKCQDVTIQLEANGIAVLDPEDMNNGSFDNCSPVSALTYDASQTIFDCSDLGTNAVILEVFDAFGNKGTCLGLVTVEDNVAPNANCQPVIAYLDTLGGTTVFPSDFDAGTNDNNNCDGLGLLINGLPSITYDCGQRGGPYIIVFTAEDDDGNVDTCFTEVTIDDTIPPMAGCQDVYVRLDTNGMATVYASQFEYGTTDNCDTSFFMMINGDSMLNLDCNNMGDNLVEYVVEDVNGNMDTCYPTLTVMPYDTATFIAGEASGALGDTVCWPITVKDFFAVRNFQFTVEVDEGLVGKIVDVESEVLVPPIGNGVLTPNFISDSVLTISWFSTVPNGLTLEDGDTLLNVKIELLGASLDTSLVGFSVDSGVTAGQIFQGCGAANVQQPFSTVEPGMIYVDSATSAVISGFITTQEGFGVCDVTVFLSGDELDTATTDATGYFEFLVERGSDVTVTPRRATLPPGTPAQISLIISTGDAGQIGGDAVAPVPLILSPYDRIAADVNNTQDITLGDATDVAKFASNLISDFQDNATSATRDFWAFVDADHIFPDPVFPWPYPNAISYNNILTDKPGTDFIASLLGDVIGNEFIHECDMFTGSDPAETRSGDDINMNVRDMQLEAGQEYSIVFRADDFENMMSFQMTVGFDTEKLQYINMEPLVAGMYGPVLAGEGHAQDGLITIGWYSATTPSVKDGEGLFAIQFKALENISSLQGLIDFNSEITAVQAYRHDMIDYGVVLTIQSDVVSVNEQFVDQFALLQNKPNPFTGMTTISFVLPQHENAHLAIYDVSGKQVLVIEEDLKPGYNEVTIERNDLPGSGVYYYRLHCDNQSATKRMILME